MHKLKALAAGTAVATSIIGGAGMASADTAHQGDTLSEMYPSTWRYVCVANVAEGRIPDCNTLITGQQIRGNISAAERHNIDVWFSHVQPQRQFVAQSSTSNRVIKRHSTRWRRRTYQAPQVHHRARQAAPVYSGGGGGGCVPDYIVRRESGGNYKAENPTSTASGKYQFLDSTWNGYGGYSHAADAPPAVQDAKACQVWDGGRGSSNWALTR
jgi:Transglycosylase-like domain